MKLILVDSHTALIPSMRSYNPGHELRASIVRHSLLVEALQFLFEAVWDASVPILTSFSADNDPRRQMLVSLLMTGSTDSAIANTLGHQRSLRPSLDLRADGRAGRDDAAPAGCGTGAIRRPARRILTRRRLRKATPAVQNRTAGVAQGEEIRAEPRGKSRSLLPGPVAL